MINRGISLLFVCILFVLTGFSGSKEDSLAAMWRGEYADSIRINAKIELANLEEENRLEHLLEAALFLDSSKATKHNGLVHLELAKQYHRINNFETSIEQSLLAISYFEFCGYKTGKSQAINNLGIIYAKQGAHYDALFKFNQVLDLRKELKDSIGISASYNNLGNVYRELGRYDQAREYYNKAMEIRQVLNDESEVGALLNNIGLIYLETKDYENAKTYFWQTIRLKRSLGELNDLGLGYTNLGVVYTELNELDSAKYYLDKALRIRTDLKDMYGLLHTRTCLAGYHNTKGDYTRGHAIADSCYDEAQRLTSLSAEKEILYVLYQSAKGMNDAGLALEYHEKYLILKDSIRNSGDKYELTQIESSFSIDEQIAEIERQKREIPNKEEIFYEKDWFVILIFFVLLSGLVILLETNRKNRDENARNQFENIDYMRSTRILYVVAAVFYILLPYVVPTDTDKLYDPFELRGFVSGMILFVYLLTFWFSWVRRNIDRITKFFFIVMLSHHFYLVFINDISIEHFLFLLVLLSGVTAVFRRLWTMVAFALFTAGMTFLIGFTTVDPGINVNLFIGIVCSVLIVSAVVAASKKDLDRHLEFSNEVVNQADALVFILNRRGENIYTSQSIKNILGHDPSDFTGHDWIEKLGLSKTEANRIKNNMILVAMGTIEPQNNVYQPLYTKSGQLKWLSIREKRLEKDRVLVIGLDVTEHKRIQDELAESESNFRQINETLTDVFYLYNIPEGKYEYISPNSAEVIGPEPDFFYAGKSHAHSYVYLEDHTKVKEAAEMVENGIPFDIEYRVVINGKIKWIREKSFPVRDELGKIIKNSGLCQDITERKNAEQEIKKLSLVASHTDNFILMVNRENRIEWANQSFYNLTGYSETETIGKLPLELISGNLTSEAAIDEISAAIFVDKRQSQYEMINYKKDESIFYSSLEVTPLLDANNELEKYFVIGTDISQRIADREQIEKLSLVASNTSNYVIIVNTHDGIEWVNEAFTEKFDYTLEEVKGKFPSQFLHHHKAQPDIIDDINLAVFRQGNKFKGEVVHMTKNGGEVYANVDITPLVTNESFVEKYFVLGVDITERKRYEEEVKLGADKLDMVHAIEQTILTSESTEDIIYNTLDTTLLKLPLLRTSLALFNYDDRTFYSYARMNSGQKTISDRREFDLKDFGLHKTLLQQKKQLIQDITLKENKSKSDEILIEEGARLVLLSPLFHGDTLIGSFNVCFTDNFDEREIEHFMQVTSEVATGLAIAIQQSQLKDELSRSNQAITSSIDYAKMIQQAYIPDDLSIYPALKEHMVINRPKDIVSGDFYWVGEYGDVTVIAVGDCTGHGVPGAFMTLIGISELNSIVVQRGITEPAEILNALNLGILKALSTTTDIKLKDGMDIGIICFNKVTGKTLFGGARRPLFQMSKEGDLKIIESTRRSIGDLGDTFGIFFSTKEVNLKAGDRFYIFSDGCSDQFGGERIRKFSRRRLEEVVRNVSEQPLHEQKNAINEALLDWQGMHYQTDDILFVGLRLS